MSKHQSDWGYYSSDGFVRMGTHEAEQQPKPVKPTPVATYIIMSGVTLALLFIVASVVITVSGG